jgi:thiol-disulfide isomerase/thioredoxin
LKVTVFGRKDCDACKAAQEKIVYFAEKWGKAQETLIEFVDMDTPDGLAEGAYRDVYEIPTVIFEEEDRELVRWVKKVPLSKEFKQYFLKEVVHEEAPDKGIC